MHGVSFKAIYDNESERKVIMTAYTEEQQEQHVRCDFIGCNVSQRAHNTDFRPCVCCGSDHFCISHNQSITIEITISDQQFTKRQAFRSKGLALCDSCLSNFDCDMAWSKDDHNANCTANEKRNKKTAPFLELALIRFLRGLVTKKRG